MARPPGRCIFCNGFGLTKEHVFPDWMRTVFTRLPTDTHTFYDIDYVDLPTIGTVPLPSRRTGQGQVGSKKVKVVCRACNNGWLSQLEQNAKPLLTEVLNGRQRTFSVADQKLLATWIVKTTMTAEFWRPKEIAIKQPEREEFRLKMEPSSRWQIWGALYIGTKLQAGAIYHHGVGIYLPPNPVRVGVKNTQYTVMGIGRFLAINLSSEQEGLTFGMNPQLDVALIRLWPPIGTPVSWPLARSIDDPAAERIIAAFAKALGLPPASL